MAAGEITGASPEEVEDISEAHLETPLYNEHEIPFETAYCLQKIGKQPDEYDGPQRYCKRRAAKKDEADYDCGEFDKGAYAACCKVHGGDVEKQGRQNQDNLENPRTVNITHGTDAEDKHLIMDFDDQEQELYDKIMEKWPEIYDWPDQSEDPARYRILRRVAVNEVRSLRQEDYLDDHEVHIKEIPTENGVQTEEVENPLAREYRLLMSEITNQMRELGLTPKERQKMDTLSSEADKADVLSDVAQNALNSEDGEYDPERFDE